MILQRPQPSYARAARTAAMLGCVIYPWLHAGARGPTPAVDPLLVSLISVALLLALAWREAPLTFARPLLAFAMVSATAIWIADVGVHGGLAPSPYAAAAWTVLATMLACAALGGLMRRDGPLRAWTPSLLAWAWLAASVASTVIALMQYAGIADMLGPLAAYSHQRQAYGNLRQKNQYATLVSIGLLSVVWLTLHGTPRLPRWAAAAAALLLCAGAAASASRTGAIGLVFVLSLAAWWHRARLSQAAWLFVPLLGYALAAVVLLFALDPGSHAGPALLKRLAGDGPDCPSRPVLWSNLAQLVRERPWQGWGWGELPYAFYYGDFEPRFCALVKNAHNLPLQVALEFGIPAALALCAACLWGLLRARPWAQEAPDLALAWGAATLIGLHSLVEYPLWYGPFQISLGLCLGIVCAESAGPRLGRGGVALLACAFTVIVICTAWDYHRVRQLYLPMAARSAAYQDDTYDKVKGSWIFQEQVAYAQLARLPLNADTADEAYRLSTRVLHFAPEPRVIEKRIESARLLGLAEQASAEAARYRTAFPAAHADWLRRSSLPAQ